MGSAANPLFGARTGGNTAGPGYANSPLAQNPTGNAVNSNAQNIGNLGYTSAGGEMVSTSPLANGMPSSYKDPVTGVTVTPDMVQNYWAPTPNPYGDPNHPTFVQATSPGQFSPSQQLSPQSYAAQFFQYQTSPGMTQAATNNQFLPSAAGDPYTGKSVNINGVAVPWNNMSQMQQAMYDYYNVTGQNMPTNFMSSYQGQNNTANQSYNQYFGNNKQAGAALQNYQASQGMPSALGSQAPYGANFSTTPYGSTPLAQMAQGGATTPQGGTNGLNSYLSGLLMQALFGGGSNQSNQNNVTTTPLGYTQYQGTPQSSTNTNSGNLMNMLAYLMLNQFISPNQASSGGAALGH